MVSNSDIMHATEFYFLFPLFESHTTYYSLAQRQIALYQDQTPQNAASDQGLNCLLTECSMNFEQNVKYLPTTLKIEMDWSN